MPDQQLTLFAAHWEDRFRRAPWVAPHDTAAGLRAGETAPEPGWVCPVCGQVEPSAGLLAVEHGWDPHVPDARPWHGYCWRSAPLLDRDWSQT